MNREGHRVAIQVGIDEPLSSAAATGGYVGRVIDVTPDRAPAERDQHDLVIPLGADRYKTLELKPGEYIVEAVSPAGELLDKRVSIGRSEEGVRPVRLEQRGSLGDTLCWQAVAGNIDRVKVAAETAADDGVKEAERLIRQGRGLWRRLGAARILLVVVAVILAAVAALWTLGAGPGEKIDADSGLVPASGNLVAAEIQAPEAMLLDDGVPAIVWLALFGIGLLVAGILAFRKVGRASREPEPRGVRMPVPGAAASKPATVAAGVASAPTVGRAAASAATSASPAAPTAPALAPAPPIRATLFRLGGDRAWELLDAAIAGTPAVEALLESLEHKAMLDPREDQGFRFYDVAPDHPLAGGPAGAPLFAFVPSAGFGGDIVAVPLPWNRSVGGKAGLEIAASTNAVSTFSTASAIKDADMATILGYMAAGRLRQAEILVREAQDLLNLKYDNPLAAALGAYVLLSSCSDRNRGGNWRPWIGNLHRDFPWLADGAVLEGWNLLQLRMGPADLDRACVCFLEAVGRGIPVFVEGIRLLQTGLAAFGRRRDEVAGLDDAIDRVDRLATRCSPTQAFTTIRVSRAA